MNSKYFVLLKNGEDVEEAELKDKAIKHAHHLINCMSKGSEWIQIETIKDLKYFVEFEFVKKALMQKFKSTKSKKIKLAIKEIHNNSFNTSDIDELINEQIEQSQKITKDQAQENRISSTIKVRSLMFKNLT